MKVVNNTGLDKLFKLIKADFIKNDKKGAVNGVATLDENGKVPYTQIPEFLDLYTYGISWDTTASSPVCTRIGNPLLHKELPIQSSMRGCVHQGKEIQYFLDADDWTKKADGTASHLDGTDGSVGVHIMKFYGKSGATGTKRWVRISTMKLDDSWEEIPEAIVGAYRATVDNVNTKAVTVKNTAAQYRGGGNRTDYDEFSSNIFKTDLGKPRTAITRSTMRTYARNSGSELMFYNYYKWLCWLYYIEYANFNCQAAFNAAPTSDGYKQGGLGDGISTMNSTQWGNFNEYYPLVPCGYTDEFGNGTNIKATGTITDGTATTGSGNVPRWRGIEQPFGDIWTNLDGIIAEYDASLDKTIYYATWNPTYFGDTEAEKASMEIVGYQANSDGWVTTFDLGEKANMVPTTIGGSPSTYKCDYSYQSHNAGLKTVRVGGYAYNGTFAGLAFFTSNFGVGVSYSFIGFRLITLV